MFNVESLKKTQEGWEAWSELIRTCFREDNSTRPTIEKLTESLKALHKIQSSAIRTAMRDVGVLSGVNESTKLTPPMEDMPLYENMKEVLNDIKRKQLERKAELAYKKATIAALPKGSVTALCAPIYCHFSVMQKRL